MTSLENKTKEEFNKIHPKFYDCVFGFDYTKGIIGAGVMGFLVFGINYLWKEHELSESLIATAKQSTSTFLLGGKIMALNKYLATNIHNKTKALFLSIILPSALAISINYGIHSMKGTPEPVKSTYPSTLVIPATIIYGFKEQKKYTYKLSKK